MSLFSSPSAASSTTRARRANPCAVRRRPAKPSSSRRSAGVNSIATAGFPIDHASRTGQHDLINFSIRTLAACHLQRRLPNVGLDLSGGLLGTTGAGADEIMSARLAWQDEIKHRITLVAVAAFPH